MGEINKDWFTERLRSIKLSQRQQPEDMLDRFCVLALADGRLMTAIIKCMGCSRALDPADLIGY